MSDWGLITDIHTHVLHALDDGPPTFDDAIQLLRQMKETGVDRAFSTSHYNTYAFDVRLADLDDRFTTLCDYRATEDWPTLALGAEVRLLPSLVGDLIANTLPTLGLTRYVLVEFPGNNVTEETTSLVHEIRVRGYQPILAHPERNIVIQKNPAMLDDLIDLGLLFQLTADCFVDRGRDPHTADKLAWEILRQGKATVIASDTHNVTTRPPALVDAYHAIAAHFGNPVVEQLVANANAIWDDVDCVPVEVPQTVGRSSRWTPFRRR